jgi:hypothetical protein
MKPIELRRLDPARNVSRFYRLAIKPDLFGGVRLQWQIAELRASLDKIAVANAAMAAELN